jgi:hypothetical protein
MLFSILFSVLYPNISSLPNHLLSLNRLAFINDPALFTASKLLREPDVWKFGLAFVLIKMYGFIVVKNLRLPVLLWTFLSHRNLSLTFKNFKMTSQRKFVRPVTTGKGEGVGGVALESEGVEVQRGLKFA